MSGRVEKASHKKTRERLSLSSSIASLGTVADMPCSFCFKRGLGAKCRMIEKSSRCQECTARGRSCDGFLVAASLERLATQEKRLSEQEEEASQDLEKIHSEMLEMQTKLSAAMGRLSRIRRIRKSVKNRRLDEVERGMMELDKEDGLLSALDAHEKYVVSDLQALGVPNSADWLSFGVGDEFADLGPLSGNPSTPPLQTGGGS
jgi:hypothetical protein